MAIYVDDVLLTAESSTASLALKAIASVWECAEPELATTQHAVSFCGFEIQANEAQHGGGYRLHQHGYEEELLKKWEIKDESHQLDFKLPTPEEEAEFQRSEDLELTRRAQACTGALLWLNTRTRPELSVGVAAMSRCERTVEAFSDISYASTKGYKSLQGQVYFYAGAPALVGGRATSALVAAIRDEDETKLVKRLWGDNAAAISLATGEGQGSWRTRHLRIRAAILRSALHQNEWHLGHLTGRELVADSFTKVVLGLAFERALQDLGIVSESTKTKGGGAGCCDKNHARIAMMIGASLLTGAAATTEGTESGDELSWLWTTGIILMCVGAVFVTNKAVRSGIWLGRRLLGSSGSLDSKEEVKGQQEAPQVRMLQCSSSSEEEKYVRRATINQSRAEYVPRAEIEEIHAMMAQSLAVQQDPHNKMHGRSAADWQSDDDRQQKPVRLHTSDDLPRRRKKKNKGKKTELGSEEEDAAVERTWRGMFRRARNVAGAPQMATSKSLTSPSGSGTAAQIASSSMRISSPSGSRALASSSMGMLFHAFDITIGLPSCGDWGGCTIEFDIAVGLQQCARCSIYIRANDITVGLARCRCGEWSKEWT
eukprot:s1322_g22.t1